MLRASKLLYNLCLANVHNTIVSNFLAYFLHCLYAFEDYILVIFLLSLHLPLAPLINKARLNVPCHHQPIPLVYISLPPRSQKMKLAVDCSGDFGKTCMPLSVFLVLVVFAVILVLGLALCLKRKVKAARAQNAHEGNVKWYGER